MKGLNSIQQVCIRKIVLMTLFLFLFFVPIGFTQEISSTEQIYRMPTKIFADLVDAPTTPSVSIDPNNEWMLIMEMANLPTIADVSQPELRLAGLRINPNTNGRSRAFSYSKSLKLKHIIKDTEKNISGLPSEAHIENIRWSPNGKFVAFSNTTDDGIRLWFVDISSGTSREVANIYLNAVYGTPFSWMPDNQTLVCKIVLENRGNLPQSPSVPPGPVIQENIGKKAPVRTFQDLLKSPYDEKVFSYYANSQVALINLNGTIKKISKPGIISTVAPSPNGKYLLAETIHKPFSYLVPAYSFPHLVEIWDLDGNIVKKIADLPLAEEVPVGFGAVPKGPRSFDWRSDKPATLYWVEAQDEGDPKIEVSVRDKIFTLSEPFTSEPQTLAALGLRYGGITWGNENLALIMEWWWKNRNLRIWHVKPDGSKKDTTLLADYSFEDRYSDPGSPIMITNSAGHSVLLSDKKGSKIYLIGNGASPEGDRPFLDEFDIAKKKAKRLWRSEAPYYERPIRLLDKKKLIIITRKESKTEPPNYYLRDLKKEKITQKTNFPHPTPQIKDVQKEQIRYDRKDGVTLTATLYLPPKYKTEQGPLPMLMWAYPTEFKSADAAGQVTDSPYRFVRVGWWSPILWVANGYAVFDDPSMPIIGEGDAEPNDTYVEQLVSSAEAAVEEVVKRGVAERGKIAIGGHSYGAFMTANLLAHSDLFALGIARSGAYNRTLTPFGFQAEERTYWEAPETYYNMSPFMHADKVNEPILLIHGQADNNSGTFPIQSERFYHALKGHGATARLVMLPHESHGYVARESILHMLWEMDTWMEKYVKKTK